MILNRLRKNPRKPIEKQMSTNDVPGANPANNDKLSVGNWAEHQDGSLIFVKGLEDHKVIYEIYDLTKSPILVYTDAMPQIGFETEFSWDPANTNKKTNELWTWHDKTSFPWNKVIKSGATDGPGFAAAEDLISAAARVANSLSLRSKKLNAKDIEHHLGTTTPKKGIISRIQSALSRLRPGKK